MDVESFVCMSKYGFGNKGNLRGDGCGAEDNGPQWDEYWYSDMLGGGKGNGFDVHRFGLNFGNGPGDGIEDEGDGNGSGKGF